MQQHDIISSFDNIFDEFIETTENFLSCYIPEQEPRLLYEPIKYILSGKGKRIRPVLSMICCGAVGGNPVDALNAGASIEILHNFTLVHDDIMDKSPIRRGRQTVHLKWDEPTAILTGDSMVGLAYKCLDKYTSHTNYSLIIKTLTDGLIEVCEGQVFDMMYNTKPGVTTDDYFNTISKKTAKILETSCLIGAYAGNANQEQIKSLSDYSLNLGIAFQIQDDILDLIADEAELGKHIGQDIIEGKKTWLMIEARKRAEKENEKKLIAKFFANNGLPEEEIDNIRDFMVRSGIIDDAWKLANNYFDLSINAVSALNKNQYTEMLTWFAEKISKRIK